MAPAVPQISYSMDACHSCSKCFSSGLMPSFLARGVWCSFLKYLGTKKRFSSIFCDILLSFPSRPGTRVAMTDTFNFLFSECKLKFLPVFAPSFLSIFPPSSPNSSSSANLCRHLVFYRMAHKTIKIMTTSMVHIIILSSRTGVIEFHFSLEFLWSKSIIEMDSS